MVKVPKGAKSRDISVISHLAIVKSLCRALEHHSLPHTTFIKSITHFRFHVPYSAKLWRVKTLVANRSFQSFGEENVGKFTIANISNLEFGWVKYW